MFQTKFISKSLCEFSGLVIKFIRFIVLAQPPKLRNYEDN